MGEVGLREPGAAFPLKGNDLCDWWKCADSFNKPPCNFHPLKNKNKYSPGKKPTRFRLPLTPQCLSLWPGIRLRGGRGMAAKFLLHVCMTAKLFHSCLPFGNPVDCSPLGSHVHGILQARILEWVAMASSRGSS